MKFFTSCESPETLYHAKKRSFTLFYAVVAGSVRAFYAKLRLYKGKRALRAAQLRARVGREKKLGGLGS